MATISRPWSEEEDHQLLAMTTAGESSDAVAAALGRTHRAVTTRLYTLREGGDFTGEYRAKDARCTWTPDQDSLLLLHYGSMSPDELAALVGKSPKALRNRISRLRQGQTRGNVLALPGTQPDARPADIVRLTQATLNRFLEPDYLPVESQWRAYDDFRLRLFYGELPLPLLAHLLGRTPDAVRTRLATLNWSLDKAIAFRLEVSRSPLWVEALQCLQAAPGQQRAAVAEAKRTQTRRVINDLIKVNHGSAHERLANLTGYIAKLQRDLENAE